MFWAECPAVFRVQCGSIHLPDIQKRTQWKCDHTPDRMRRHIGQRDPVVTVQELTVGRSGSGIMMHARPFDVLSKSRRRRVIKGKHDATVRTRIELLNDPLEDRLGKRFRSAANADEAIVKSIPVVRDSTGGKPR